MIQEILATALGGAIGAVLRMLLSMQVMGWAKWNFPVGILIVNWLGCFLIGWFAAMMLRGSLSPVARAFWMLGICGGFTTFSSFSLDTWQLFMQHRQLAGLLNCLLQLVGGVGLTALGLMAGA